MTQLQQQQQQQQAPSGGGAGESLKAGAFPPPFYSSHYEDYAVQPAHKASGKGRRTPTAEGAVGVQFEHRFRERKHFRKYGGGGGGQQTKNRICMASQNENLLLFSVKR